jgi:hypothetical protein
MAQLFQPTNITPDTRGAFGNGIILKSSGENTYFEVSWQINGNTPMTAYKIDFLDMSGTLLLSTGKLELATPVYGTLPDGNPNLYYHEFGPLPNTSSFFQQTEGLMRITQWWGSGANDFVEQLSPSHYIVRDNPRVVISSPSGSGATRVESFTGKIYGADEDGIMWIRWVLTNSLTSEVIKDTGRLYGSVEPAFTYDGFLPGNYELELSIETSIGIQASSTFPIYVSYDMSDTGIPIVASRDCNGESAVSVRWARLQDIPLVDGGTNVVDNGRQISLNGDDSFLKWNIVNRNAMNFEAPWSAIWCGKVSSSSHKLFEIDTTAAKYTGYVLTHSEGGLLMVQIDVKTESGPPVPSQFVSYFADWVDGPFMCCITPTTVYWKCTVASGGVLYPLENLYPSETLYPGYRGEKEEIIVSQDIPGFITQGNVTSVSLFGPSVLDYFMIVDHGMSTDEVYEYFNRNKTGSYGVDAYFYLGPKGASQDYNAGNFTDEIFSWTTIEIYRQAIGSSSLDYVGSTRVRSGNKLLDYAARSQQGPYKYYLYILSSDKYINIPSISNEVDPCFWDWTVLSCTENSSGIFTVNSSYNFGRNLQSGRISNNNQPGIFQNFTPYPTVMIAPQNYQGGTLQSLIGVTKDGEYSDTIDLRDAIYSLSLTTNVLFLKNRKGDLMRIRPSGEISMDTMDNTREQAQTVAFQWVEVGDASDVAIYGTGGAS